MTSHDNWKTGCDGVLHPDNCEDTKQEENMAHQKIEFKYSKEHGLTTPCPHGMKYRDHKNTTVVGGFTCMGCEHFVSKDRSAVVCAFIGDMTDVERERYKEGGEPS